MTDIHPCNCETCDNVGCKAHPSNIPATDAGLYGAFSRLDQEATWRITSWFGCASHPQAREYLMRDVIEELENKAMDADAEVAKKAREEVLKRLSDEIEEMDCMGDVCCRDYLKEEVLPKLRNEAKP